MELAIGVQYVLYMYMKLPRMLIPLAQIINFSFLSISLRASERNGRATKNTMELFLNTDCNFVSKIYIIPLYKRDLPQFIYL